MKRYLHIYLLLIRLNYHKALYHRADFLKGLFANLTWGVFSFVAIYALSARSGIVYGWSRTELFVLVGVYNIIVGGFFRALVAQNFDSMSRVVQRGDLDTILLKPISSQFLVSFLHIRLYGLIRVILATGFTVFILLNASIAINLISALQFIIFGILGFVVIYSMWFLVMTFSIWFPDIYNLNEILYAADNLTRYPPQVIFAMKIFFFVIFFPYTLVVSIPTKALLHKITSYDVVLIIVSALGLLIITRKFWKFALRFYTSASG